MVRHAGDQEGAQQVAARAAWQAPPGRDRGPIGWPADSTSELRGSLEPRLAGRRGAVLGHRANQPGLDEDLRQFAGIDDLLGEVAVGPEVVVVEEVDRQSAAPLGIDALDGAALDKDRQPWRAARCAVD